MIGSLVWGRVRIKIRIRVIGLGLRLTLGFTAGTNVGHANFGGFAFFHRLCST